MNKEEFLDESREDWWFVEPSDDAALSELRDRLGATLGYDSDKDWYTKRECLETLWASIEGRSDLVSLLDEASDTDRRNAWIETVIQTEESEEGSAQPSEATAASLGAPPVTDTEPAQAEAAAAAKKSPFARKSSDSSAPVAEPAAPEAPVGPEASAASETTATPEAPAAPRSPFRKKAAEVAPVEEVAPAAEAPAAPVEHVNVEEFKKEISVLLENPSVPLNAEELDELAADPEFDQKLAEATAAFAAELESDGDEDEWDEDDEEEMEPVEG